MAQNIDELQIEIQSDATDATTGLDNLVKSLEKLRSAVGANAETARGLKELIPALKDLGKLKSVNLTKNIQDLSLLGKAVRNITGADFSDFGVKINTIVDGMTKLAAVKPGNLSTTAEGMRVLKNACSGLDKLSADFAPRLAAIGNSFTTLSASSKNLNSVNFTQFKANIEGLSGALQPLQGWRSQASSVLNALNGFPDAANALNEFGGFDAFGEKVQLLAEKMKPLGEVRSKLGATLDALTRVSQVSEGLKSVNFDNFGDQTRSLGEALGQLNGVDTKLGSTLNNLSRVGSVANELATAMRGSTLKHDIKELANALSGLNKIQKTNLGSIVNQLAKIPEVTKSLNPAVLDEFAIAIERLTGIVGPLAEKMQGIYNGFSILPGAIKRTTNAMNGSSSSAKRASGSFGGFFNSLTRGITKLTVLGFALRKVANLFANWLNESNSYIENYNLFRVTMGDATDAAVEYAEKVRDAMGIDIAGWMKYQGTFQQLTTGFGVAANKAGIMSQNLTQLAYDLSSFFNVDVETAFDKISSGMSGQIKGLKEYGINLSVAALQEYALSKGITLKVSKMTEAQKSLLRYNLLMERSVNAQGDMARTLITPANSLRILSAQITQFKRALGNVVSVIAVKVIPYVQAFVRVLTEAAEALAELWGFALPDIDYDGMSSAFADADEDADSLSGTLGEIKKQLMGFDELNILSDPNAGGTGGSIGGNDLDMELLSYDFLDGIDAASTRIYTKMKEGFEKVVDVVKVLYDIFDGMLPLIEGAVVGLLVFKGATWIADTAKSLKGLMASTGKMGAFKKTGLMIAAVAAEIVAVYDGVKGLTKGTKKAVPTILSMAAAIGVAGVACYAAAGPMGLLIAGVAALIAGLAAYGDAVWDMKVEAAQEQFFDGIGVKVSDLADDFDDLCGKYTKYADTILANKATMDQNENTINETKDAIANMTSIMADASSEIALTYIPQIKDAFVELEKAVSGNLDLVNQNITLALATAPESALQRLGLSTGEIISIVTGTTTEMREQLGALTDEVDEIAAALELDPNNKELLARMNEITVEMQKLSGATSAVDEFKGSLETLKNGINFEDKTTAEESIAKIKQTYEDATQKIDDATSAALKGLETLKDHMSSEDYKKVHTGILVADATQKQELLDAYSELGEAVVQEFEKKMTEGVENFDFPLVDYADAWLNEATGKMDSEDFLGIQWAKYTGFDTVYQSLIDFRNNVTSEQTTISKAMENLGISTVEGYTNGIEGSISDVEGAGEDIANAAINGTAKAQDSHSPSKEFEKLGLYGVQGYVNGVVNNFSLVTEAWSRSFNTWFAGVRNEFSETKWTQLGTTAMNGLRKALKLPELPKIKLEVTFDMRASADKQSVAKALGLSGWPNLKWKAYADGGFPAYGEMFIAKERGPELVGRIGSRTAVANNDQIVAGVANGVYQGVAAAMRENGGGNGGTQRVEIRIPLEIGNRVLGEAVAEWNNDVVKQTGKSPLLT